MSLIKCPNCGHDLSDKARRCPHCNYIINHNHNDYSSQTEEKSEEGNSNKLLYIIITLIVLLIIGFVCFITHNNTNKNNDTVSDSDSVTVYDSIPTSADTSIPIHQLRCYENTIHYKIADDYDGHQEGDSIDCYATYTLLLAPQNKAVLGYEDSMEFCIYSGQYKETNGVLTIDIKEEGVKSAPEKQIYAQLENNSLTILRKGMFMDKSYTVKLSTIEPSCSKLNGIIAEIEANNYTDLDYLKQYQNELQLQK